jgi:hypothetical protein
MLHPITYKISAINTGLRFKHPTGRSKIQLFSLIGKFKTYPATSHARSIFFSERLLLLALRGESIKVRIV